MRAHASSRRPQHRAAGDLPPQPIGVHAAITRRASSSGRAAAVRCAAGSRERLLDAFWQVGAQSSRYLPTSHA